MQPFRKRRKRETEERGKKEKEGGREERKKGSGSYGEEYGLSRESEL